MIRPPTEVRVQRTLRASAEDVFSAWLSPSCIEQWMFGRVGQDEQIVRLEVDARVGGRFSFLVHLDGHDFDHVGEYLVIEPPRRLAFTWNVGEVRADGSRVELELTPRGDGVLLTLVHTLPADVAPFADRTRAGWMRMLGALAQVVERGAQVASRA